MTTENNKVLTSAELEQKQWLLDSHLALQRFVLYYVAPLTTAAFLVLALVDSCWQTWTVFGSFCLTAASWPLSLRLTRRDRLDASMVVFMISLIGFLTLLMMLVQGTSPTSLTAAMIMVIYSSLFSRRFLYYSTAGALFAFLAGESVRFFELYPMKILTPGQRFGVEFAFAVLLIPLAAIFLNRARAMNARLVQSTNDTNREMSSVIDAAAEVGEVLEDVVGHLQKVSDAFAAQANEQAESVKNINKSIEYLRDVAQKTASSAADTRSVSAHIQEKSVRGSVQLQTIAKSFEEVVHESENARVEFVDLAEKAENIEDVLGANREIAAQIKILAINAAVQAAKAGKYGPGFRVVASELKGMIQRTEESLNDSRELLEGIRTRAKLTGDTMEKSASLLKNQMADLGSTGALIQEISAAYVDTSSQVEHITTTAKEQQTQLDEVGSGISHLDTLAGELSAAAALLLASVDEIVKSNHRLQEVLSTRNG